MKNKRIGQVFLLLLVVALPVVLVAAVPANPNTLAPDELAVRYNNDGTEMPIVISGITELRVYTLHDELFQLAVYVPYRERAFVFTQVELNGYTLPNRPAYPVEELTDQMHHTYDPMISDVKLALNKAYIAQQYQLWFGRPHTQDELNHGLYKLFQKVQRMDYEWRLASQPEAILYGIAQQRGTPATPRDEAQVRAMLEKGLEREDILAVLV